MNLKDLVLQEKTMTFDFPGFEGFKVDLTYLGKEELLKLSKEATKTTWERKTNRPKEEFDADKFITLYSGKVIKGWKGLKIKYLKELTLIDPQDYDDEDEVEFNHENAELLLKNSTSFDNWITDTVNELTNFTKSSSQKSSTD
jgi:hypothetical protein